MIFYNKIGAPERIRTSDLRIRSPLLYPLSHRRAEAIATGKSKQ
jgi:hypothetical protein